MWGVKLRVYTIAIYGKLQVSFAKETYERDDILRVYTIAIYGKLQVSIAIYVIYVRI